MITKLEGPAQQRCGVCDWPIVDNGTRVEHIGFDHPAVPATPTPSQPAAREWDDDPTPQELMAAYDRVRKERDELKQQTAAKDVEIAGLNANLSCLRDQTQQDGEQMVRLRRELNEMQDLLAQWRPRAEAAERERDSLREALTTIRDRSGCICDHSDADCCAKVGVECDGCLAALTLAALKAGKEG